MSDNTVTRASLADAVYHEFGYSRSECSDIIDSIFDYISDGLKKEGEVKLPRLGTFKVCRKSARVGRNPKTKEEAVISARNVVSFYLSNVLKKELNEVFEERYLSAPMWDAKEA